MFTYITKRLLAAIPTLLIIITIAFFMMRIAPGGPFDAERQLPPEIEANILKAYDLDKPLYQQYFIYVGNLLRFDFGPSYKFRDFSVTELILTGLPASMQIGGMAILIAALIGISLGTLAALYQNQKTDYAIMGVAMTGIAIPNFVVAPILSLIFGVYLSWLPVAGWGDGSQKSGATGNISGIASDRLHCPPDPWLHGRSPALKLHSDRPGQRSS